MKIQEMLRHKNQILYPFEFEQKFYLVRFVERGKRLDCSGVFRFAVENERNRLTPFFWYEAKQQAKIQKLIKLAKEKYKNE